MKIGGPPRPPSTAAWAWPTGTTSRWPFTPTRSTNRASSRIPSPPLPAGRFTPTTPKAFGVVGVNRPAGNGGDGILDEARFVERVGVNGHLDVVPVGHAQAAVDGGRGGPPIFMKLQAASPGLDLLVQRARQA